MIDKPKGDRYISGIVISPDPEKEDTSKHLYLWQITEQTMLILEERLRIPVPFIAAEHDDHSGARHVHLLACAKARIERQT
jgi:hypothetical protein